MTAEFRPLLPDLDLAYDDVPRHPSMERVDPDGTPITGCVLRGTDELRVRLGGR
jgi:hypothetical protein